MSSVTPILFENIHWVFVLIGLAILVVAILAPVHLWRFRQITWTPKRQVILGAVGTVCLAFGVVLMLLGPGGEGKEVTYYEFYGDLDRNGKTSFKTSTMTLAFYGRSGRVRGHTTGMVGSNLDTWKLEGYYVGDHMAMVLSAEPNSTNPNPGGIGSYQVQRISGSYSGMITYWDTCLLATVHCPVLLSNSQLGLDAAAAQWPNLFKGECKKLNLTPDGTGPVVAANSCPYASN
jgi:hypothetical protein